jgi:crotonobetainyl-CoA:carnitine CoA-transferase CaiB-like acyl-CoA transferase
MGKPDMPGPLHGYRVVDLTSNVSGPLATMILADQGADVIKVENPDGGDATRSASNRRAGLSASFLNTNRNKRSVALDLRDPAAKQALLRLVATADVFIQNFRPGVAERMEFGEDALRVVKPDIVYVSISGFGETGPYSGKPVYDPIIQAMSSLATIQAGSDTERPRLVRTILPDKLTAVTASQAITAALLARERTGAGQHVRLSMLDAVIYETATDYITAAVQTDKQWLGLTRALEKPEWPDDPRFRTPALRQENVDERLAMTQAVLKTRPAAEWLDVLTREDVPCAPVLTRSSLMQHPQVRANGIVVETEHEKAGLLRQARPAARFSVTQAGIRHGAPVLGQDTDTILSELGYSAAEIATLRLKEPAA